MSIDIEETNKRGVHMALIEHWIQYVTAALVFLGYPGLYLAMVCEGLGLPFPGDVFLAFYGYSIAERGLNAIPVFCFGTLGYFTGVLIVFTMTRRFGNLIISPLYRLRVLNKPRLDGIGNLIQHYAALVLIPGRFLPGVRSLSTYAASLSDMSYGTFSLYSVLGSMVWCGVWIGFGYWFGENVDTMMQHVQTTLIWLTVAIVSILLLLWLLRRLQAKANAERR
ncbi:DedA family protein [Alicyclobacillus acidiphilus]|uniref:DedA family protein n=1 Tax=Alicyclobacillus acidiphilus TaxID=182455 RepID=UPI001FE149B3|nr:DedA family protein [Alicyclobacillus acidiphilus]